MNNIPNAWNLPLQNNSQPKNTDPNLFLISTPLNGNENYIQWKYSIQIALGAKKKSGFIDGTLPKPTIEGATLDDWLSHDCMVRSWLLNSISKDIVSAFVFSNTARELWLELEEHFGEKNGPLVYQLQRQIASINQGDSSLSKYYTKLKLLWDQLACIVEIPPCTCGAGKALSDLHSSTKLMQFLMGLNDTYDNLRNQILVLDPLPSIHKAYLMALSVEKQREVQINFSVPTEVTALLAKSGGFTHANKKHISSKQKFDSKTKPNSDRFCEFCKTSGHTKDACFKLHGYPDWYKDLKDKKKPLHSAHMVNQEDNPLLGSESSSTADNQINPSIDKLFQQFTSFLKANQQDGHFANLSHFGDFAGPS